jgi:cytochrome d ubiquinol oxidase subunit II
MSPEFFLPLIWAMIIGFGIVMYVLLDGFDLGIGILFLFNKKAEHRDIMMNSIAPLWDGNETWLVLGGMGLLAAFPKAYAMILPALYLPLIFFLFGLILRGVAFEFRFKATKHQYIWDWSFAAGAILATFMQGIVLGRFVEGFPMVDGKYIGTINAWFTPFSITTSLGLLTGYGLLGATWLIVKTEGELQEWCRKITWWLAAGTLLFIVIVSIWTPLAQPAIAQRWFAWPNLLYLSPIPFYTGMAAIALFWSLWKKHEYMPFISSIGLFLLAFFGLGISIWPYIVPRVMTIWKAASPPNSQLFILTGALFLIPMILAYTVHAYWIFRGKVKTEDYYH